MSRFQKALVSALLAAVSSRTRLIIRSTTAVLIIHLAAAAPNPQTWLPCTDKTVLAEKSTNLNLFPRALSPAFLSSLLLFALTLLLGVHSLPLLPVSAPCYSPFLSALLCVSPLSSPVISLPPSLSNTVTPGHRERSCTAPLLKNRNVCSLLRVRCGKQGQVGLIITVALASTQCVKAISAKACLCFFYFYFNMKTFFLSASDLVQRHRDAKNPCQHLQKFSL